MSARKKASVDRKALAYVASILEDVRPEVDKLLATCVDLAPSDERDPRRPDPMTALDAIRLARSVQLAIEDLEGCVARAAE